MKSLSQYVQSYETINEQKKQILSTDDIKWPLTPAVMTENEKQVIIVGEPFKTEMHRTFSEAYRLVKDLKLRYMRDLGSANKEFENTEWFVFVADDGEVFVTPYNHPKGVVAYKQ